MRLNTLQETEMGREYIQGRNLGREGRTNIVFLRKEVVIIRVHPLHVVFELVERDGFHGPREGADGVRVDKHWLHLYSLLLA